MTNTNSNNNNSFDNVLPPQITGEYILVFGSARFKKGVHPQYDQTYNLISGICRRNKKLGIVTGGGPGTMMAANKAAKDNDNLSVGYGINFAQTEKPNIFCDTKYSRICTNFKQRKDFFFYHSAASGKLKGVVMLPGGFGTLDELYEVITLMQLKQIPKAPIFLVELTNEEHYKHSFWKPVITMINRMLKEGTISKHDIDNIFHITSPEDHQLMDHYIKNGINNSNNYKHE